MPSFRDRDLGVPNLNAEQFRNEHERNTAYVPIDSNHFVRLMTAGTWVVRDRNSSHAVSRVFGYQITAHEPSRTRCVACNVAARDARDDGEATTIGG